MRTIKFRAWQPHDSLHRKPGMYQVTDLIFYSSYGGGEVFLAKPFEEAVSSEYLKDIKLMQYTGLHDKNGIEIYEGDIVKFSLKDDRINIAETSPGTINISDKNAGQGIVKWLQRYCLFGINSLPDMFEGLDENLNLEVIGNIYENPDLVKDKP